MSTRSSQQPRRRGSVLRIASASMLALALALPNVALAGDPPPQGDLDPSLHEEFVAAQQAMENGQYKDAQVLLEGIANQQAGWTPAGYNLGVTLEARGKLWKASKHYRAYYENASEAERARVRAVMTDLSTNLRKSGKALWIPGMIVTTTGVIFLGLGLGQVGDDAFYITAVGLGAALMVFSMGLVIPGAVKHARANKIRRDFSRSVTASSGPGLEWRGLGFAF